MLTDGPTDRPTTRHGNRSIDQPFKLFTGHKIFGKIRVVVGFVPKVIGNFRDPVSVKWKIASVISVIQCLRSGRFPR